MTSKEMREKIKEATQREALGSLGNLGHMWRALSKRKKIPTYLDPMTPAAAAWVIVGTALCPSGYKKALEWVEQKERFWRKIDDAGGYNVFGFLKAALRKPDIAAEIEQVMIDKATGVALIGMKDGQLIRTSSITDVQLNFDRLEIQDVTIIKGRFLVEIAEELAAVAEAAEIQQN